MITKKALLAMILDLDIEIEALHEEIEALKRKQMPMPKLTKRNPVVDLDAPKRGRGRPRKNQ